MAVKITFEITITVIINNRFITYFQDLAINTLTICLNMPQGQHVHLAQIVVPSIDG